MIVIVLVLWGNWELLAPYVAPSLRNPFAPFIFLSYYLPDSAPDPPRYAKGPLVRLPQTVLCPKWHMLTPLSSSRFKGYPLYPLLCHSLVFCPPILDHTRTTSYRSEIWAAKTGEVGSLW